MASSLANQVPCYSYDIVQTPLGSLPRPQVPLGLAGPGGKANVLALWDSGSDVILIPASVGELLGFKPTAAISTYGVSGSASGELFTATVTLGGQTFQAPIFVAVSDEAPILVGRAGTWSRFDSFTFHNAEKQFCFGDYQPVTYTPPYFTYIGLFAAGAAITWLLTR